VLHVARYVRPLSERIDVVQDRNLRRRSDLDVYPDAGYTPFRGTKGTVREGGNRVPAMARGPKIKADTKNYDIVEEVRRSLTLP
jgi:arylsulfatase A-like enzyme